MKFPLSIITVSILALFAVSACKSKSTIIGGRDATMADAQAFLTSLEAELKVYPSMKYNPLRSGQAAPIKTMDSYFTINSSEVNVNRLGEHAQRALDTWGQYSAFSTRGHSGGGHRYSLDFGNHETHAFVDLIAHDKNGETTIECLTRVIE